MFKSWKVDDDFSDEYASDDEEVKNETIEPKVKTSPTEAIVVLLDTSGSMDEPFYKEEGITRNGAVNAFLAAFVDKTIVFNYHKKHVISLFTFNTIV